MAANPLIAKLTMSQGGHHMDKLGNRTIVPGLASLIITPLVIYKLYPPEIKETPDAAKIATEKLKEMGPFKNPNSPWSSCFIGACAVDFRRKLKY